MPEDLFDYFNKNSTRKFEPIDDPDFNTFEENQQLDSKPKSANENFDQSKIEAGPTSEPIANSDNQPELSVELRGETASLQTQPGIAEASGASAPSAVPEQPPEKENLAAASKSENHWDFLASMLGIENRGKEPTETRLNDDSKVTAEPVLEIFEALNLPDGETGSNSDNIEFSVTAEINESNPLEEMFRPGDLPAELDLFESSQVEFEAEEEIFSSGIQDPSGESDSVQIIDDELEFLEFEIEELESYGSRSPDITQPGRRRRQKSSESKETENDPSDEPTERKKRRDQPRSKRSTEERSPGPTRTSRRQEQEDQTANAGPISREPSGFGAGLFDDEPAEDLDGLDPRPKSNRRRRRRRGAKSESTLEANENTKNVAPSIENDPPDEFFDEIGWEFSPSDRSAAKDASADRQPPTEASKFDDVDEFEDDSADSAQNKTRRRRRRGSRSREKNRESTTSVENEKNLDYSSSERGDEEATGKVAKFPTWEEAIAGLVQSNIKNHSRFDRGGRSSSGGKRRR